MNTEIFDYLKALSKKEFYYANFFSSACSIIILIAGIISITEGASSMLYTIMFGCASVVLWINAYKCFRRGSKSAWFFALVGLFMCALTAIFIYVLVSNGGFNG